MINREGFLIGEKEVLKEWKRLLVREWSDYIYTIATNLKSLVKYMAYYMANF